MRQCKRSFVDGSTSGRRPATWAARRTRSGSGESRRLARARAVRRGHRPRASGTSTRPARCGWTSSIRARRSTTCARRSRWEPKVAPAARDDAGPDRGGAAPHPRGARPRGRLHEVGGAALGSAQPCRYIRSSVHASVRLARWPPELGVSHRARLALATTARSAPALFGSPRRRSLRPRPWRLQRRRVHGPRDRRPLTTTMAPGASRSSWARRLASPRRVPALVAGVARASKGGAGRRGVRLGVLRRPPCVGATSTATGSRTSRSTVLV